MTSKKLISEVLSAHADHLLAKHNRAEDYAQLFPGDTELPPLLSLADHVKSALQPVNPLLSFKEQLQRDLMAAARIKQFEQARAAQIPATRHLSLLIAALVIAGVVLSGLLLRLLWRQKNRHLPSQ
jgi:hypothetical protein